MLPVSSMSNAAIKLRNVLLAEIDDLVDINRIRIGHPKFTLTGMEEDMNNLNLFFYNVNYDGYPADGLSGNPFYVRLYCLITAVGAKSDTNGPSPGENDLRLIGEVMRVLHQQPVISVDNGDGIEIAQLQIVPHSLDLDNLNHIWSTQGDTAYRLSVAYEMALAPIPLAKAVERSARVGEIGTASRAALKTEPLPEAGYKIKTSAKVVPKVVVDFNKPDWLPHICFADEASKTLDYSLMLPASALPATDPLQVLVAGKLTEPVDLVWETWNSTTGWVQSDTAQSESITVKTIDPDSFFAEPFDSSTLFQISLPIDSSGQAALYAERVWQRPDGSSVKLRSNPLLVTVTEVSI